MSKPDHHDPPAVEAPQNDAGASMTDSAATSPSKEALSGEHTPPPPNGDGFRGFAYLMRLLPRAFASILGRVNQRLPAGLEIPVAAAGLVLILAAGALALYGIIVTTRVMSSSHAEASPEELFRRGYISRGLAEGMRRVDSMLDAHGEASPEACTAFIALARMLESAGEQDHAAAMVDQARHVAGRLAASDPRGAARCDLDIAAASLAMDDHAVAEAAARNAADTAAANAMPTLRIQSLAMLGAVLAKAGQPEAALAAYQEAMDIALSQSSQPATEAASLRLDAARAAILSRQPQVSRSLLSRVHSDAQTMGGAALLRLQASALEARLAGVEDRCGAAIQIASGTLDNAQELTPNLRQSFARSAGRDLLAAMRSCAADPDTAKAKPALLFLERLAAYFDAELTPGNPLRIKTLERLAELSNRIGRPERTLALNARLLAMQASASDGQGNGFDSLMDRDARLMKLLARLAAVESPPQDVATLAFGAWLSRRVLFPPTGAPDLNGIHEETDEAMIREFSRLTNAISGAASPALGNGGVEPALFAPEAHARLVDLSQSIAERQASLKPALLWAMGPNDGYASAVRTLAAILPEDGGLLFFARTSRPPKAQPEEPADVPHVLAFLLTRTVQGSRVHVLDIGAVDDVEETIRTWREARDAGEDDANAAVRLGLAEVELYSLLWVPVRRAAPGLATIWIGPGDPPSRTLSLLPYGTLPTPEGQPLAAAMHLRWLDRESLLASMQESAVEPAMVGLLSTPAN